MIHMAQRGPRKRLAHTAPVHLNKTCMFVGDPQSPSGVLRDRSNSSGHRADRNKPVVVQIAKPKRSGNPDSSCTVLEKGVGGEAVGFVVV
jgi:hypothetical protein